MRNAKNTVSVSEAKYGSFGAKLADLADSGRISSATTRDKWLKVRWTAYVREVEAYADRIKGMSPGETADALDALKAENARLTAGLSRKYGDWIDEFLSDRCRFSKDDYVDFGRAEAISHICALTLKHAESGGVF